MKEAPKKKVEYRFAGKESITDIIRNSIPKELTPTKRFGSIFGIIFLLVVVIAIFQFPFSSLLAGNADQTIKVGFPWTFLEFSLGEMSESPAKIKGLIFDILIYLLIAYAIDVAINIVKNAHFLKSKLEKKKYPHIFKPKPKTFAEKATEKVIAKPVKPVLK